MSTLGLEHEVCKNPLWKGLRADQDHVALVLRRERSVESDQVPRKEFSPSYVVLNNHRFGLSMLWGDCHPSLRLEFFGFII